MSLIGTHVLSWMVCCSIFEFHSRIEIWVELAVAISIWYIYIYKYVSYSRVAVWSIESAVSLGIKSICNYVYFKLQSIWAELAFLTTVFFLLGSHWPWYKMSLQKPWVFHRNALVWCRSKRWFSAKPTRMIHVVLIHCILYIPSCLLCSHKPRCIYIYFQIYTNIYIYTKISATIDIVLITEFASASVDVLRWCCMTNTRLFSVCELPAPIWWCQETRDSRWLSKKVKHNQRYRIVSCAFKMGRRIKQWNLSVMLSDLVICRWYSVGLCWFYTTFCVSWNLHSKKFAHSVHLAFQVSTNEHFVLLCIKTLQVIYL